MNDTFGPWPFNYDHTTFVLAPARATAMQSSHHATPCSRLHASPRPAAAVADPPLPTAACPEPLWPNTSHRATSHLTP
jgi:hypothetical protein